MYIEKLYSIIFPKMYHSKEKVMTTVLKNRSTKIK